MADIIQFVPRRQQTAQRNLAEFIRVCRNGLTVFGADLDWSGNYWESAGVTFGNLDQKTRKLDPANALSQPFLEFAKAYFRYQQGHKPTGAKVEMRALKCVERALADRGDAVAVENVDASVLDRSAVLAKQHYSAGTAYHVGREISRLGKFLSDMALIPHQLDWRNPISRPVDTVRTGQKAKKERERKLPSQEALDALADTFAANPTAPRDIFTTSVVAMLLCAPSRVSEVLALPENCEVWERKRDGTEAYGWRFQPGKGGAPMIKWIPDAMVNLAQEAIRRIRHLTAEGRSIAKWLEENPSKFYRHPDCPKVPEMMPLTKEQTADALGIHFDTTKYCKAELRRLGLSVADGANTLSSLNRWVRAQLPAEFPWFDRQRGLKYADALFCLQKKQLRTDMRASAFMVWKPTANTLNEDLGRREAKKGYVIPSIFDRFGATVDGQNPLKVTSHQFRHLLNTIAQRGGMSQTEIARWSGRADAKQNRVYDHMSEFELVRMLRDHDAALTLDRPMEEIAEQIRSQIPMTRREFNMLSTPTAHVTEYGFCVHDFVMSPCQRFRDCLNCSEQVCVKGDRRLERLRVRYKQVKALKERAEREIADGSAGADRWYDIHDLTEKRLAALIEIMEDPSIKNGTIVRLRNEHEFNPLRRAVEAKAGAGKLTASQQPLLDDLRGLLEG